MSRRSTTLAIDAGRATAGTRLRAAALTLIGWCLLAVTDILMNLFGVRGLLWILPDQKSHRGNDRRSRWGDPAECCRAVDRARAWYFKRAWCLQSAAAAVCLMRAFGWPARFFIGVRSLPFSAHAWAEVAGDVVINDRPALASMYTIIVER